MASPMPAHVVVLGAGSEQVDGVYTQVEREICEGCPVYGNLGGFFLTASRQPESDTGRMLWGWIIGRSGVPAYACPSEEKAMIPESDWQCFQGEAPGPSVVLLPNGDADALAAAYAREARLRAGLGDLPAASARRAAEAYERAKLGGAALAANWTERAKLHAEHGQVLRSLAKTDAALAEVNAALELRPELPQALQLSALLWNDSAEAGKSALAAKQCFMLLSSTMPEEATSDKRRWQLRLLRDCEHLLAELGESLDSSLPRCYGASFDEDSSLTVCANEEMVVGLE
ncbi:unnamed protein product, partial [Polarella glacialis]